MSSTIWDKLPSQLARPQLVDSRLVDDPFWGKYEREGHRVSVHVAILAKEYLDLILANEKTIESRFSIHRRVPYQRIEDGDVILFKQTSGPILGIGYVDKVNFFEISDDSTFDRIKECFGDGLRIQDASYWERYARSCYGTLIHLNYVRSIVPMSYSKKDRNAWVVFD